MSNVNNKDKKINLFSDSELYDRTKILELSNFIDEWEQNILFAQNGYYSLKGTEADEKYKEFVGELESFVNEKINKINFLNENSKEILNRVKNDKIKIIIREMQKHKDAQMKDYFSSVFANAVSFALNRAVLHKNNPEIILSSFKNGLTAIELTAVNENISNKELNEIKKRFKSEFYIALINSFAAEKNINAVYIFEKNKDHIAEADRKKLDCVIKELKINLISYEYAKELFSCNLSDKALEKEIKSVKDDETRALIKTYIKEFEQEKKRSDYEKNKSENSQNWKEISDAVSSGVDNVYLYINYALKPENIKHKKEYISLIRKNGFIKTDAVKFLDLLGNYLSGFEEFKLTDISDARAYLSDSDFELFSKLQNTKESEYNLLKSHFKYILKIFEDSKFSENSDRYEFCKLFFEYTEQYKQTNKKVCDISEGNKIISDLKDRYLCSKKQSTDKEEK